MVHLSLHAVTELKLLNVLLDGDILWKYLHTVKRVTYSDHGLMQHMNALWRCSNNTLTLGGLGGSILHCRAAWT